LVSPVSRVCVVPSIEMFFPVIFGSALTGFSVK